MYVFVETSNLLFFKSIHRLQKDQINNNVKYILF